MKKLILLLVCLLGGCETFAPAPTLDATDAATIKESVDHMAATLPPEDQTRLKKALVMKTHLAVMVGGKAGMVKTLKPWHGLTARQIIAVADRKAK